MLERPDVARADYVEVEFWQGKANLGEPIGRDRDLGVFMHASRRATVEIDRPSGHDAPGSVYSDQPLGHLTRVPWIPLRSLAHLSSARWKAFVDLAHGTSCRMHRCRLCPVEPQGRSPTLR